MVKLTIEEAAEVLGVPADCKDEAVINSAYKRLAI